MKKSLSIFFTVLGLLLILILAAPFLISWNQYKDLIEQKASAALGRTVNINGDVRFGILPTPFAKITDVVIANPQGAASKQFATVKSLDVGVALLPLLSKEIKVSHITINEPAITFEVMANGQNNWTFTPQSTESNAAGTNDTSSANTSAVSIDDFKIEKAYVRYIDVPKKSQQMIGPIEGKFEIASLQGPITGRGTVMVNANTPVRFEAKIDSLPTEANGVIPVALGLNIVGGAAEASFKGNIQKGDVTRVRGETALGITHLDKILAAVSKDGNAPKLPDFLQKKLSASGLLEYTGGKAAIDNLLINSGGMEISGGLNVDTGSPMTVALDLARVVLPPELATSGTSSDGAKAKKKTLAQQLEDGFKQATGLLDTALPTSPMNFVVTATQLPIPNQPTLRDVRVAASVTNNGVRIQNVETKLPGNTVVQLSGELPKRNDGKMASATVNASVNSQNIQAAFGDTNAAAMPLNARTTMVLTRDTLRLQPLQIVQNGQTVQGDVVYNPKAADALTVALKGSALNLDAFLGRTKKPQAAASKDAASKKTASNDPLAALQGLKAHITADLGSVTYKDKTARTVAVDALLSQAGLKLTKAAVGDLGGMVVQANGSVGRFNPLGDVDLSAKASTPNLSQTLRSLGNEAAQNLGASSFDIQAKGDDKNLKVGLNGTIDQGRVAINGTAKDLNTIPTFAGNVDITHPETATIVRNFGGLKPTTNLGAFALKSDVAYGGDTIKADNLTAKLGSAGTLQGKINILPQGNGRSIDVDLKADKLALAALMGDSNETTSQQAAAKPVTASKEWSREAIDLDGLRNLNGQANIVIGELLYKKFVIKNFKTNAKFAGNAITLNDFRGSLFDAGNFSVNGQLAPGAKGQAHRGNVAITINDTDAKKLFEALGSKPFSEGTVDINQKMTFSGASPYDLVRNLNGDGELKVTNGVVNGIDLDALAAKLDRPNSLTDFAAIIDQARAGGQTPIGDLTAPITIRNGIGSVDNISIKTQKTAMGLRGNVNLPEKTVDIAGQITFVEQRNLPPLTLLLKGPMDAPNKSFDTRSFTSFYAQKATERLQEKATEKIQGKLNKLLGVKEQPAATQPAPAPTVPADNSLTPATSSDATTTGSPTAPTPPAAPAAKPKKPEDALKELGGQMLQNMLGGGQ